MSGLRLRHVALVNPPVSEWDAIPDEELLTFVPLEAVWPDRPDFTRLRTKAEVSTGYTRFKEGDVIVPKITPTFEADRSLVVAGLPTHIGAGTTELHVIRPSRLIDAGYVNYLVSTRTFLHGGEAEMIGVAGQKRVPDAWLRDCPVPITSIVQQRAIADFLDREAARIDALISAKRRMLELLETRFRTECGALTSYAHDGSPWPTVSLRWSMKRIVDGTHGTYERVADGMPLLSAKNLEGGRVKTGENESLISEADYRSIIGSRRFAVGDVLLGVIGGSIGNTAVLYPDDPLAFQRSVAALSPGPTYSSGFLYYVCRSSAFQEQLVLGSNESAQAGIYLDALAAVMVPCPPLEAQENVGMRLAASEDRLRRTSSALTRQIELLVEHRQALITAAVTGELAIPGVAA